MLIIEVQSIKDQIGLQNKQLLQDSKEESGTCMEPDEIKMPKFYQPHMTALHLVQSSQVPIIPVQNHLTIVFN